MRLAELELDGANHRHVLVVVVVVSGFSASDACAAESLGRERARHPLGQPDARGSRDALRSRNELECAARNAARV